MVLDVLVANQLNFFIVYFKTYRQPERCPCPLVDNYMLPRPSDESFLIGGRISPISLASGMGELDTLKGRFHKLTNHAKERQKTVVEWVQTKRNRSA